LKIEFFFFEGMQNREVLDQVSQHKYQLLEPNGVEFLHSYYDMMLKCWDQYRRVLVQNESPLEFTKGSIK